MLFEMFVLQDGLFIKPGNNIYINSMLNSQLSAN